jgi:excinuclease ABC subunit C
MSEDITVLTELTAEDIGAFDDIPDLPAVFMLWPRAGKPYLARTNVLRKRLRKLWTALAGAVERIEYRYTGSRLEAHFLLLELARKHLGPDYRKMIRLRLPVYLKLVMSNPFPRIILTTQISRSEGVLFGPFRSRSSAVKFESEFLDLFQLRRCQDDLAPNPDHPGCIYGEMGKCLRPCQQAVGIAEYRAEANRLAAFLKTGGKSLAGPAESERELLSNEMDFEGAAMMHQRCQRIGEVLGFRDEMTAEVDHLNAIAVTPSTEPHAVELGWLRGGYWKGFSRIEFSISEGKPFSMDARLRELASAIGHEPSASPRERTEQLAVMARWRYSSWCDGELLMVDDWGKIPYRRLVNAVARIAHASPATPAPAPVAQPEPHPSTHS